VELPRPMLEKLFVLRHISFLANARSFLRLIWKAVYLMKTNKYLDELKAKSVDELQTELVSAKKELFNLKFQNATNQLDNTARIKEVRRNIARIQTVITQNAKA
jgi:large subunit ribosomal protein L29